ncbi:trimeric intracellular cation channel family protein [Saccharomonospora sp. NPDC006951]
MSTVVAMQDAASTGIDVATRYLDLAGVLACALLGGAVARAERLDLFGFIVVGIVSGLGGGVIRDVLLQHGPPVALTDYAYLPTALAGALIAFVISTSQETWDRLFTVLDAAVIGFWSVTGAQKTLAAGLSWLPAILLGTVTAVGGGATRDVLLGRIPAVFGGNALYATVAAATATVMVVCSYLGLPVAGIVGGILFALVFRLVAVRRGWSLPNGRDWQPHSRLAAIMRGGARTARRGPASWQRYRARRDRNRGEEPGQS